MQFRLRTLLIVLAVGPMVLALAWRRTKMIRSKPDHIVEYPVSDAPIETVSRLP